MRRMPMGSFLYRQQEKPSNTLPTSTFFFVQGAHFYRKFSAVAWSTPPRGVWYNASKLGSYPLTPAQLP